jgi:hypothetical protein
VSAHSTHEFTLTGTQAGGAASAVVLPRSGGWRLWRHNVQAAVTLTSNGTPATATAGTLSVRGKAPGAATFQELGVIALGAPEPAIFEGFYEAIEAVSTGFDADKTWTLYTVHGD